MSATELFKIICVTCQAKLSVRNQALIGQIVACPRCSSMVEIHAPAETSGATKAAAPIVAAAVIPPAGVPEPIVEPPTGPAAESTAGSTAGPTVSEGVQTPPELSSVPQLSATQSSAIRPPAAQPPAPEAMASLAKEAATATASAGQFKMIALAIGSFVVGAAVVGGVLLSSGDSPDEVTLEETNSVANVSVASVVETPPVEISTTETTPDIKSSVAETLTPTAPPTPTIDESPIVTPIVDSIVEVSIAEIPIVETVDQPDPVTPTVQTPKSPPNEAIAETLEPPAEIPLVAQKFDPLDFDPENLSLALISQPSPSSMSSGIGSSGIGSSVIESSGIEETPPAEPIVLAEVKSTELPLVRVAPEQSDHVGSRDAKQQLALLVPGVQIEDLPLVDCLRLISQLSGVPISISPEQLLMAGFSPLKSISMDASEISLGELLSQTLTPLRLVYETHGSQVLVKRKGSAKSREISYKINDLVNATTDTEQIATWIEQLVAPQTWEAMGGAGALVVTDGKLQITQTQQVQYQVLIFLERLRLTRNLPQSSRFPIKRLAGQPAQQAIAKQLATSTTFTFSQYTPLDEIFAHWQTELGVAVLVDWPALADEKLWPSTKIACSIVDQSWSKALKRTLEPLGLGWRATHGGAIEITSLEKVQNELQLEIYPLGGRFTGDAQALVEQLRARSRRSANAGGLILLDPAGKSILSLQPAALQREVARELGKR